MYALFVRSGYELMVLKELEKRGIKGFVPQQIRLERRRKKWHTVPRLLIPSYVFVEMPMTPIFYYLAKNTVGAIAFVGGGEPLELSQADKRYIRFLANNGKPIEPLYIDSKQRFINFCLQDLKMVHYQKRQRKAMVELDFFGDKKRLTLSVIEADTF